MAVLGSSSTNPSLMAPLSFIVSTTYSPPYKMKAVVHVFGGGGSGGLGVMLPNVETRAATGAGAGEHSASIVELDPTVTYTISVGAGGASQTSAGAVANQVITGLAGGTSSFAGSGITTITANGGGAGQALAFGSRLNAYSVAGGIGGTGGAGNLFTLAGGAGGAITKPTGSATVNNGAASGGGSTNLTGTAHAGGAINMNHSVSADNKDYTSGGGGTNGDGGGQSNNTGTYMFVYGGNPLGPATDTTGAAAPLAHGIGNTIHNHDGVGSVGAPFDSLMGVPAKINLGTQRRQPGAGGNSIGYALARNNQAWYGTAATVFGGGAGWITVNMHAGFQGDVGSAGRGGFFGGGGGAGCMGDQAQAYTIESGTGGRGGIVIDFLERVA